MKPHATFVTVIATLLAGSIGLAQPQMSGAGPGWNVAMTKLFGDVKAFSAKADMRVLDSGDKESISMGMTFALLDGMVRMEMDLAQMKSASLPSNAVASLKQMGMDRLATIVLPDKKAVYVVYPGLQAYVDMPLPEEEAAAAKKDFKIGKTELGKETIDGHACRKSKVIMTSDKGEKHEILVWEAADLKNFPLQMRMSDKGTNVVIRYKDVQFARPDAKQFEAPAGYARHGDVMQLMQVAMQRMMNGAGKK